MKKFLILVLILSLALAACDTLPDPDAEEKYGDLTGKAFQSIATGISCEDKDSGQYDYLKSGKVKVTTTAGVQEIEDKCVKNRLYEARCRGNEGVLEYVGCACLDDQGPVCAGIPMNVLVAEKEPFVSAEGGPCDLREGSVQTCEAGLECTNEYTTQYWNGTCCEPNQCSINNECLDIGDEAIYEYPNGAKSVVTCYDYISQVSFKVNKCGKDGVCGGMCKEAGLDPDCAETETAPICQEIDNGKDPDVFSQIRGKFNGQVNRRYFSGTCTNPTLKKTGNCYYSTRDRCTGKNSKSVLEGFCEGDEFFLEHIECEYDCFEGKCMDKPDPVCIDDDEEEGKSNNYFVGGTVRYFNAETNEVEHGPDRCDQRTLKEWYCENGTIAVEDYWCDHGCFRNEERCMKESEVSIETDGISLFTKGVGFETVPQTDKKIRFEEFCDGNKVVEFWNEINYYGLKKLAVITFKCPNGCEDGACLPSEWVTETCVEENDDYSTRGTVKYSMIMTPPQGYKPTALSMKSHGFSLCKISPDETVICSYNHGFTDFCYRNSVIEYSCNGNQLGYELHECPNGCEQGACIDTNTTTTQAATPTTTKPTNTTTPTTTVTTETPVEAKITPEVAKIIEEPVEFVDIPLGTDISVGIFSYTTSDKVIFDSQSDTSKIKGTIKIAPNTVDKYEIVWGIAIIYTGDKEDNPGSSVTKRMGVDSGWKRFYLSGQQWKTFKFWKLNSGADEPVEGTIEFPVDDFQALYTAGETYTHAMILYKIAYRDENNKWQWREIITGVPVKLP